MASLEQTNKLEDAVVEARMALLQRITELTPKVTNRVDGEKVLALAEAHACLTSPQRAGSSRAG